MVNVATDNIFLGISLIIFVNELEVTFAILGEIASGDCKKGVVLIIYFN